MRNYAMVSLIPTISSVGDVTSCSINLDSSHVATEVTPTSTEAAEAEAEHVDVIMLFVI